MSRQDLSQEPHVPEPRQPVSSWGRLTNDPHHVVPLIDRQALPGALLSAVAQSSPDHKSLAHGMGRSYGDVCLNPQGTLWSTAGLNKYIHFDPSTGHLTAEAGVLLQDIQQTFVPRGWMLPVTPGSQFVTLGGAIANDVHGKNHHALGTLGKHVHALQLWRTDGSSFEVSRTEHPEWLQATVGGLGLTGVISQATLALRPVHSAWLDTETLPYNSLDEFFALADASEEGWEYTVSWVDCLSGRDVRGIFMRANHPSAEAVAKAGLDETPRANAARAVPFVPPVSLINALSLRAFNMAYFHAQKAKQGRQWQHYQPFFYPLDHVRDWNRIYGPRGFYQYQCVVPRLGARESVQAMMDAIARDGQGSFLAVLKTFGVRDSAGLLSFPMEGVTLALDFPNLGERTLALQHSLDAVVREAGGRLYPAKDARMSREMFEAGYPNLPQFMTFRDPGLSSAMSRRLMGW
jgi:FAD/FMN-containing dehydrogenase